MGILDQHPACRLNFLNAPAIVSEQNDVSGRGINRKVFIQRGNLDSLRLKNHAEQARIRDRSAVCDRRHAGSAPRMQAPVHAITQQVSAIAAASRFDAFVQQRQQLVKVLARGVPVWISSPQNVEKPIFVPGFSPAAGNDLLHQHIDRRVGNLQPIQFARAHLANECSLLEQIVPGGCEEESLGNRPAPVSGAPDSLHRHRHGPGRVDLADQVDIADVDAQLQRRGRDQNLYLAILQPLLRVQTQCARERAVVRGDMLRAQTLGELERNFFNQAARVDEDQCAAVVLCHGGQLVEDLGPHRNRRD